MASWFMRFYTIWFTRFEVMHVGSPGVVTKFYPYLGCCATVRQSTQTFRARVWYGGVTELTEDPGIVALAYRTPRRSGYGYNCRK